MTELVGDISKPNGKGIEITSYDKPLYHNDFIIILLDNIYKDIKFYLQEEQLTNYKHILELLLDELPIIDNNEIKICEQNFI